MSPFDDFVHISTMSEPSNGTGAAFGVPSDYIDHSKGRRVFTEGLMADSLRRHHPKHHLTITPPYVTDLIAFGKASDEVTYSALGSPADILAERQFIPPARRYNDETGGSFIERVVFGGFNYVFRGNAFIVYVAEGGDGAMYKTLYSYILVEDLTMDGKETAQGKVDELLKAATKWSQELHNEVLVFDNGFWQKSTELWQNVQKARWDDVILEKGRKDAIINDVIGFFNGEDRYEEFGVPWKRGVIFYGPPGNGKTISTKALMHDVSTRTSPSIECLYVKSFNSYMGPESGIRMIFLKARQMAPCLLIFEDIDSLVNVSVRSYFLNEVDGLESNHGILMIGSTNHLEKLDPGIAKRPSRFDRKYFFEAPNREERVQYCEYWRHKLRNNKKVDFPKEMCDRIADITGDFSFAYMKEAFVAALLVIAAKSDEKWSLMHWEDPLSGNILWKEIKRQVENLRKEMEESEDASVNMKSGMWPSLSTILDDNSTPTGPMDIKNSVMPRYF